MGNLERAPEGLIETIYVPKNDDLQCRCEHGCIIEFTVIPYVATPKAFGECEHFRYVMLLGDDEPTGKMTDSQFCTCGGKYTHVDTVQGNHPVENWWSQDTYQCDRCKTWCYIAWDTHGVETGRTYERDTE